MTLSDATIKALQSIHKPQPFPLDAVQRAAVVELMAWKPEQHASETEVLNIIDRRTP